MPIQPHHTRSLRRIKIRTPGNKLVIHYEKRKPQIAKCANCKKELKGISREFPSKFRNLPLSQKRVSRLFGGNLCSKCSREAIISRFNFKDLPLDLGQICVKISGRESGNICIVIDKLNDSFVLIDGCVKRRRCNILHLKTLDQKIDIKKNESHENIAKEFKKLGYEIKEKKPKREIKAGKLEETKTEKIKVEKKVPEKVFKKSKKPIKETKKKTLVKKSKK